MTHDPEIDPEYKVYNRLTRVNTDEKEKPETKWTLNLILCCLTVATGSLQFGYNISSNNSVTNVLTDFIGNHTFMFHKLKLFKDNEQYLLGNETKLNQGKADYEQKKADYLEATFSMNTTWLDILKAQREAREKEVRQKFNMSIDEYLQNMTNKLEQKKAELESHRAKAEEAEPKVRKVTTLLWALTNCLFVIGGMIGSFSSKFIMDRVGRKTGIVIQHMFGIIGSVFVLISWLFDYPICMMISRLLFGIQGGMSCTFVPTYLSEISPVALRGRTGIIHQLFITIGILIAQIFGMRQLLGSPKLWYVLLAFPCIPALIGSFTLMFFMPESPRALLSKNKDQESTRAALAFLRNTDDVEIELDELISETKGSNLDENEETISVIGLFKNVDTRMPIITSLVLHITQQMSGINAVFFYSSSIFADAGISVDYIQYAILSTGIVNVITTIICVPLIDKLGRKPLLVYPMAFMIIDFVVLILLLTFKGTNQMMAYMSIICIMLFVISFAIGLGPIPFIYTAECFRHNARSSAMALSTLFNWSAGLALTLIFPIMQSIIQQYVFLIFSGVLGLALIMIVLKVPETKGKSIEEIIARFSKFKTDY